jgi:hypothetical protein
MIRRLVDSFGSLEIARHIASSWLGSSYKHMTSASAWEAVPDRNSSHSWLPYIIDGIGLLYHVVIFEKAGVKSSLPQL